MKKQKTQYRTWFDKQFRKPTGDYYKMLDRRATILTELAFLEAQINRIEVYRNCESVALRTMAAAKKNFKF